MASEYSSELLQSSGKSNNSNKMPSRGQGLVNTGKSSVQSTASAAVKTTKISSRPSGSSMAQDLTQPTLAELKEFESFSRLTKQPDLHEQSNKNNVGDDMLLSDGSSSGSNSDTSFKQASPYLGVLTKVKIQKPKASAAAAAVPIGEKRQYTQLRLP